MLQDLRQALPHLRPQLYFKSSLTALAHAMEDLTVVGHDPPLVIATLQREQVYRQEMRRYRRMAQRSDQVYVLAAANSNFGSAATPHMTIPLDADDPLTHEWHLVIIGQHYAACLVCREHAAPVDLGSLDQARQFEGIWAFDWQVSITAARLLLTRIVEYRPDLANKVAEAYRHYQLDRELSESEDGATGMAIDSKLFAERLMTYLQASQYKLQKAYRAIAAKERRERLINAISTTIRSSLDPEAVLANTIQELGQVFPQCRCLLYRLRPNGQSLPIDYEAIPAGWRSLKGEVWSLAEHPLFQGVLRQNQAIAIADVAHDLAVQMDPALKTRLQTWQIRACLLVAIRYQDHWLGMVELHHCGPEGYLWSEADITLVEAIATQAGVALMQAQAYSNLEDLNRQLADIERVQSNLVAIVSHELRTPLSTIQICLESLATTLQMPPELQQAMLQTALTDLERLRKLIQDFLTLSRLEAGWTHWQLEPISLQECLSLALKALRSRQAAETLPEIVLEIPPGLPLLEADGECLTELLTKLLDNACKFTEAGGRVTIRAKIHERSLCTQDACCQTVTSEVNHSPHNPMLEVMIADTGRGIEPSQLQAIFDRFYQEEGFLRRTATGTGLGLAICRRIVQQLGGEIWAESAGRNQGSHFHFTVPVAQSSY